MLKLLELLRWSPKFNSKQSAEANPPDLDMIIAQAQNQLDEATRSSYRLNKHKTQDLDKAIDLAG